MRTQNQILFGLTISTFVFGFAMATARAEDPPVLQPAQPVAPAATPTPTPTPVPTAAPLPTCETKSKAPLFQSTDTLALTMKGAFPVNDETTPIKATIEYVDAAGTNHSIPIGALARGKSRMWSCAFKPIKIVWDSVFDRTGTVFDQKGADMKLVVHCFYDKGTIADHATENDFVVREYALYKVLEAMELTTYKVRLAKIQYADDAGTPTVEGLGFFLEPNKQVEKRCKTDHDSTLDPGTLTSTMDQTRMIPYLLARLLVDSADFIVSWDHNGEIFVDKNKQVEFVFPYDFNDSSFLKNRPDWLPWEFSKPLDTWFNLLIDGPFTRDAYISPTLTPEQKSVWTPTLLAEATRVQARKADAIAVVDTIPLTDDGKIALKAQIELFYTGLDTMIGKLKTPTP